MIIRKIFLLPILIISFFNIAYCQSYKVETSPGAKIEFTSKGEQIIKYLLDNKIIELVSDLSLRSVLISNNKKYIVITSGEDVVGRIQVFDNNNKVIIDEYYAGKKPFWKNNTIEYEAVLWQGEGFTVRAKHQFENGTLSCGRQYIGEYHGFHDDIVDPLCPYYSLNMYGAIDELIEGLKEQIVYWEQKMKLRSSGIGESTILKKNSVSVESVVELADKIIGINNRMIYNKNDQFYYMKLFSSVCIIVGKAYQTHIIDVKTKNDLIRKMLTAMGIDEDIAPWLYT